LCRMVDRLEEASLVERRADPADRRAWRLHLTPTAHPLLEKLRGIGEEVIDEAQTGVDPENLTTAMHALAAIRSNLSSRAEPYGKKSGIK
jgi:MarR family transcriptional regulator for hemolysin